MRLRLLGVLAISAVNEYTYRRSSDLRNEAEILAKKEFPHGWDFISRRNDMQGIQDSTDSANDMAVFEVWTKVS